MNMQELIRNRERFPPEELARYAGKYVAWSPDGTRIIASNDNLIHLDCQLREMGFDPENILVSSIPFEDVILGGGIIE